MTYAEEIETRHRSDREALTTMLANTALALGDGWTTEMPTEKNYHRGYLCRHADEIVVLVKTPYNTPDRWEASTCWPRNLVNDCSYGSKLPHITVAKERGADALAHAIDRRIMPKALPLIAEARKLRHNRQTEEAQNLKIAEHLASISDGELRSDNNQRHREHNVHISDGTTNLKCEIQSDCVYLDGHVSPDVAARMLSVINEEV